MKKKNYDEMKKMQRNRRLKKNPKKTHTHKRRNIKEKCDENLMQD